MTTTATCVICGLPFDARTSYGLCPLCANATTLREFDRLQTAIHLADRAGIPASLTLVQWMSTVSDFRGKCAFCREMFLSYIEIVNPALGLIYDNVVPICRACSIIRRKTFPEAEKQVRLYLAGKNEAAHV